MRVVVSTRPDLARALFVLSRYLDSYGQEHCQATKRVLKYLMLTKDYIFKYRTRGEPIHRFADADFAEDVSTRRRTSGGSFILTGAPILWHSKRQICVALSTMEVEHFAFAGTRSGSCYWR